jgi:hypothetical protein
MATVYQAMKLNSTPSSKVRLCPKCGQPGTVIGPLATNVGRMITCDSCLHEWTDAGAEDVFDRFREQSGFLPHAPQEGAGGHGAAGAGEREGS